MFAILIFLILNYRYAQHITTYNIFSNYLKNLEKSALWIIFDMHLKFEYHRSKNCYREVGIKYQRFLLLFRSIC